MNLPGSSWDQRPQHVYSRDSQTNVPDAQASVERFRCVFKSFFVYLRLSKPAISQTHVTDRLNPLAWKRLRGIIFFIGTDVRADK